MWKQVVRGGRPTLGSIAPQVLLIMLMLGFVVFVPDVWQNPERTRGYIDADVKRALLILGTCAAVLIVVRATTRIASTLGVLPLLYVRSTGTAITLATPWGVLGLPGDRLDVETGTLQVRVEESGPVRPFYPRGIQHLYLSQGGRSLHVSSSVGFASSSRSSLTEQLGSHGIAIELSGACTALGS